MDNVVEIDGSMGEGGGQILRTAVSLAGILRKPLRITNIRARRKEPGLRPQHLQAVVAAAKVSNSSLSGAQVGSTHLEFFPMKQLPHKFAEQIDTGTAGSISLIAQTLIPISIFGGVEIDCRIIGGTEVPHSPTVDYLIDVVFPVYRKLGAEISMEIVRRGYYPRGGGIVRLCCKSSRPIKLESLVLIGEERGNLQYPTSIKSVSSSLPEHVAKRQSAAARRILEQAFNDSIRITEATNSAWTSLSPGSSVLVSSIGPSHFVGAVSLGERGKRSEIVGEEAARIFLNECACNPGVDTHLADMLATLLPCVSGKSRFTTSGVSKHLETNIAVARKLVPDCRFETSIRKTSDKVQATYYEISVEGQAEKSN